MRRARPAGSLQVALLAAMGALATQASAADQIPQHELDAKIKYCKTCHGLSGQGFRAYNSVPRIAGQQPEYFANQMSAVVEGRRRNPIMHDVASKLSPAMVEALAKHFSGLNPKPVGGAPTDLIPAGRKIYNEGVPGTDVPACASCHGPEAKGQGQFPRLAGQLHDYMRAKLLGWEKERGQDPKKEDASALMKPIAHSLTEAQIKAVTAYLNHLE